MVNPDGVEMGLTRMDVSGINLNNSWNKPGKETPSTQAIKKLVKFLRTKNLQFLLDIHSHFTLRGKFLYGNRLFKKNYQKILLFPLLLAKRNRDFSFMNSGFGSTKEEATSRKVLFKQT